MLHRNGVVNLAGQTSLMESSYIVLRSNLVISADTGFMHAADLFRVPAFALIGTYGLRFPYGTYGGNTRNSPALPSVHQRRTG